MNYTYSRLFSEFKSYIKPYGTPILWGSFLRFISAIAALFHPFAFAFIVTFITKYDHTTSLKPLYIIIALWAFSFLIRYTLMYKAKMLCLVAAEKIGLDIEKGAMQYMSHIDISWHEKENAGNKVKRIQKGASGIITVIKVWVMNVIDIVVEIVGAFIIIYHFDITLLVLIIIYLVIHFSVASSMRKKMVQINKIRNIKDEESTGVMFEIVNNIRSVKVLGMVAPLLNFLEKINKELLLLTEKNLFWGHITILFRTTWQALARILLIVYVIHGIFEGRYELGFLVLFYGYFNSVSTSIDELSNVTQELAVAKSNTIRLVELLNEKITIDNDTSRVNFPSNWDAIKIKDLSFAYGDNKVLHGVSFDIKKGEKVGLVGLSGAGKTTLFKLLLKEHETLDNTIYIGDVPLNTIKKSDYVKHVATVLQETEVFNLSLKTNIEIANEGSSDGLSKALEVSHVNDFLHKLPLGVDTLIGEKGIKLSGGERQRLGIARAVYKNPEILFLDEATSHLDVESEQKIQDSLAHFFKDVTAVVIAHRLSTIKEMDKIIVLEHGRILETGTFDELYQKDGRFREFWDKQKI